MRRRRRRTHNESDVRVAGVDLLLAIAVGVVFTGLLLLGLAPSFHWWQIPIDVLAGAIWTWVIYEQFRTTTRRQFRRGRQIGFTEGFHVALDVTEGIFREVNDGHHDGA